MSPRGGAGPLKYRNPKMAADIAAGQAPQTKLPPGKLLNGMPSCRLPSRDSSVIFPDLPIT
eukprot:CAMPEP_0115674432 /NCGR_PEP_ID=MMETSP0272-20121206/53621_1 /TAXON_ID=71861 /ORGANISM="Scrippsiella trochoidea, Strain CCMP3099" /LENGTH=60 /DNA_ID=CAMNT_0003113347 /DNA_START=442 /DNA_END=624 /DNA_ORIENTATION=+